MLNRIFMAILTSLTVFMMAPVYPDVEAESQSVEIEVLTGVQSTKVKEIPFVDVAHSPYETPKAVDPYQGVLTPEIVQNDLGEWVYDNDDYKINGYYYHLNRMWIPGLITAESQFMQLPNLITGSAWMYAPGMMEATADYNGYSLDDVLDGVALMSCAEKGNYVWLQRHGFDWEGPYKVVDCAGYLDQYNVSVHRAEVVEVGFKTAQRWGMATQSLQSDGTWKVVWNQRRVDNVIVSKINPNCLPTEIVPIVFKDWFLERVEFYRTDKEYLEQYKYHLPIVTKIEDGYSQHLVGGEWMKVLNNSIDTCYVNMLQRDVSPP